MEVTVVVDTDGCVTVTVSDEAGYSPDVVDDMCRRARETALATHGELKPRRATRKP